MQNVEKQFFSEQNEQNLFGILSQDIQQKQGAGLTRQQTNRLARTLEHYMQEVWDVNGPMPIQQLNREAITATSKDFSSYLRRGELAPSLAASEKVVTDYANQPRIEIAQQRLLQQQGQGSAVPPRPTFESNLLMDTGSRFEQLQQERNGPAAPSRPQIPDFQVNLTASGDEPSAISLYETAKKMRDAEATRVQQEAARLQGIISGTGSAPTDANPLVRFMSPPSIQNDPQANPTIAQPIATIAPMPRGPLPQDYLIKQDDIINYKETEYNLVLYSADRDWLNNTKENRYSFSVIFDPANNKQGFTLQPSTNKKFKNITRIELVKAILPTEGLENFVKVTGGGPTFSSASKINVLQYPYVLVRIPELDTNNYGTDNNIDNSFAVLQYDANWYTDTTNLSDGFLGMIPKFMKCQKIYQPTPLATLTKLTIELQRPDGLPLSDTSDTLSISNIYASGDLGADLGVYAGLYASVQDVDTNALYYLIKTSTFFSQWLFQPGNRIQIKGLSPSQITGGGALANQQFVSYLQSEAGLSIIGIGYDNGTIAGDGAIPATGYANIIIVKAPMQDPTTGSVLADPLGGTSGTNQDLADALQTTTFTGAKLINLTHQTNVVLRIITRDMDPAARVRPDNL